MALKIRLRQQGRTNRPFFRLVVADARSPRDGKYVEALGWYNPIETQDDKRLCIKEDRIQHWLDLGAQLSDNAASIIKGTAPNIVKQITVKEVERRAKVAAKRKEKKQKS